MKTSHEFEDLDDSASLEIIASIVERVTFASHQNDIAVIADLVVKNTQDEILEDLELSLECEPPLIGSRTWKIDRLAPEGEVHIRDRAGPLAGGLLSELNERMRAEVKLVLRKADKIFCERHYTAARRIDGSRC